MIYDKEYEIRTDLPVIDPKNRKPGQDKSKSPVNYDEDNSDADENDFNTMKTGN